MTSKIKVDTIEEKSSGNGVSIDGLTIKDGGITSTTGTTVFNEDSASVNFRVESDGSANMLFVDGTNNKVGINTTGSSPSQVTIEDVTGNGGGTLGLTTDTSGTSDNLGRLHFGNATDGSLSAIFGIADGASDAGALTFRTEKTGAALEERMRINSNGNIMVGTTTELGRLHLSMPTTAGTDPVVHFSDLGGTDCGSIDLNASANTVAYTTSSDYRLKENVNYDFDATTRLKELKPARFNFKNDPNETVDGFLAHEVSDVVALAVTGVKDETETKTKVVLNSQGNLIAEGIEESDWIAGKIVDDDGNTKYPTDSTWEESVELPVYQGIDQSKLVPLMVKTIQELEARITELENAE